MRTRDEVATFESERNSSLDEVRAKDVILRPRKVTWVLRRLGHGVGGKIHPEYLYQQIRKDQACLFSMNCPVIVSPSELKYINS